MRPSTTAAVSFSLSFVSELRMLAMFRPRKTEVTSATISPSSVATAISVVELASRASAVFLASSAPRTLMSSIWLIRSSATLNEVFASIDRSYARNCSAMTAGSVGAVPEATRRSTWCSTSTTASWSAFHLS